MAYHEPHTLTDQTGSRALDTVYQNTSGYWLKVYGSLLCSIKVTGDSAYGDCTIGPTSTPVTLAMSTGVGKFNLAVISQTDFYYPFCFMVPPQYYYQIIDQSASTGVCSVISWWEHTE